MQISSRFTIAVHIFMCIHIFEKDHKITSDFLADSIQVNPVVIRRLLSQLKAAGLVRVQRGSGGASMAKPLDQITFLDIYRAVDCVEEGALFHFHENPNPNCPVGRNVHRVLDGRLKQIQDAMEREMAGITLESVMKDTENCIKEESRG
ncbi:MAG TPA: Rrf2 family transcriptional regulator [Candidatus Lachnoclostridium avicola]|nr:Rrf2 family transcriptional regulator [Candidatus Lachnoclostridium avicola]